MTCLLFLASVAVLEYLLKDVRQKRGDMPPSSIDNNVVVSDPISHETSTSDLLRLGQALRANAPEVAPAGSQPVEVAHGIPPK